jgi:COMPASS component SWD3
MTDNSDRRPKKRSRNEITNTTGSSSSTSSSNSSFQYSGSIYGHEHAISSIAFSPNGNLLCSGGGGANVMISSVNTCKVERVLRMESSGISDVAWHSSSDYVGIATDDGACISDVETGRERLKLGEKKNIGGQLCVGFNPQGNLTITGSLDGVVRLWDVRSGKCVMSLEAHSRRICAASFNYDGNRFVTSSFDGLCRVWDTLNGQCCTTIVSPSMGSRGVPAVSAARFSPNGQYVLLSTLDNSIRLWDVNEGTCVKTYKGHKNEAYCAFSTFCLLQRDEIERSDEKSDERYVEKKTCIVSGSEDGKVYIWDLQSRLLNETIGNTSSGGDQSSGESIGHLDMVLAVDCHPTLPIIASGGCGKDPTILLHRQCGY